MPVLQLLDHPARSLPNINELFLPSRKLPGKFLIVSDVYPTASTELENRKPSSCGMFMNVGRPTYNRYTV